MEYRFLGIAVENKYGIKNFSLFFLLLLLLLFAGLIFRVDISRRTLVV
jgi:hypothetical protein